MKQFKIYNTPITPKNLKKLFDYKQTRFYPYLGILLLVLISYTIVQGSAFIQDTFSNETSIRNSNQSEATGGVLQNEIESGSLYYTQSRTTSDDLVPGDAPVYESFGFKYTNADKAGDTLGRVRFSIDYDTQRENTLTLDGTNDYIDVGSVASTTRSISFWMKASDPTSQKLINIDDTDQIETNSSDEVVATSFPGATVYVNADTATTTVQANQWTHIAVTDSTGVLPTNFEIGRSSTTYGNFDVAEVRIYSDVLSATEVLGVYNHATSTINGLDNKISYWKIDEGSGTSIADEENSYAGSLTEGSWGTDYDLPSRLAFFYNDQGKRSNRYGAYSFDGVGDYITGSNQLISAYPFTVTAWIKTDVTSGADSIFDLADASEASINYRIMVRDGDATVEARNNGATAQATGSYVADNGWHHVVGTFVSNNERSIYVDGLLVDTNTDTRTYNSGVDSWHIGRLGDSSPSNYFDGLISDVRVYSTELSDSEIYNLYSNGIDPTDTLVGHWKLDGNLLDETSNGYDGNVNGATSTVAWPNTPPIGRAFVEDTEVQTQDFDATNDFISISDSSTLSFGNTSTDSPFSIGAWVYANDAGDIEILNKSQVTPARNEFLFRSGASGNIQFILYDFDNLNAIGKQTSAAVTGGEWHYIVGTYNGSSTLDGIKIYVDGGLQSTSNIAAGSYTAMHNHVSTLHIGKSTSPTYHDGRIANVAVWNDVRTSGEISADYKNGWIDTSDGNLVSYWPLSGDFEDKKGSNDGTNNGSTEVDDALRPQPEEPTQQTIALTSTNFASTTQFFYQMFFESLSASTTYALDEITLVPAPNFAPVITSNGGGDSTAISHSENTTTVTTVTSTDADFNDTPTYSIIGGADSSKFTIASSTGVLDFNTAPDYENPTDSDTNNGYVVEVQVSDTSNSTDTQVITVSVQPVAEFASTDIALSTSTQVENTATTTPIGALSNTDADDGDTYTYGLNCSSAGADDAHFSISSTNLHASTTFNYESPSDTNTDNSYEICIRVSDGTFNYDENFTVTVTNANETPTDMSLSTTTVAENVSIGTTIGTLSTTDPDSGDSHTYTLVSGSGDTDNSSFSITGSTLFIETVPDYETKTSYSVRIQSEDSGSLTYAESFTITVIDGESPTDISITSQTIDENSASGTAVGTLSTTDDDIGDSHTYALSCASAGTDDASFSIASSTLSIATVPDFETKTSYSICIRTTDSASNTYDKNFTITVNDLAESSGSSGTSGASGGSRSRGSSSETIYGCTDITAINYDNRNDVTHRQDLCLYYTPPTITEPVEYFIFEPIVEEEEPAELEVIEIQRKDYEEEDPNTITAELPDNCVSIYLDDQEITTYLNRFSKEGIELTSCDISTFSPDQLDRMLEARSFDRFSDEPADDKKYYDLSIAFVDDSLAPIEGLKVTLFSEPRVTLTNSEGVAFFRKVEEGDHEVIVDTSDGKTKSNIILSGDKEVIQLKVLVVEEHSALAWWLFGGILIVLIVVVYMWRRDRRKIQ